MNKNINIPNTLSLLRLISAPVIVFFLLNSQPYLALVLFIIAAGTDAVDGYIARNFNQVTKLGRILDPISDKLLYLFVLYGILIRGELVFWMWFFAVVTVIFIISIILLSKKKVKYPTILGKSAHFFEFFVIIAMILGYDSNSMLTLFTVILAIPLIDYSIQLVKAIKK